MNVLCNQMILCFVCVLSRGVAYYYEYVTRDDHISLAGTEMASEDRNNITFTVKGCYGAVLHFLSRDHLYTYVFEIEIERGSTSQITKYSTLSGNLIDWTVENDTSHVNLMKCKKRRTMQINWEDGYIHVRSGYDKKQNDPFLSVFDTDSSVGLEISSISSDENRTIDWIFGDNLTDISEFDTSSISTYSVSETSSYRNTDFIKTTTAENKEFTSRLLSVRTEEGSTEKYSPTTTDQMTSKITTTPDDHPTTNIYTTATSPTFEGSKSTIESSTGNHGSALCRCECPGTQDLPAKLRYIRQTLHINKVDLSSNLRRKHSAPDSRASSRYLGYLGISVIVGVCLCILLADITRVNDRNTRVKPLSKTSKV